MHFMRSESNRPRISRILPMSLLLLCLCTGCGEHPASADTMTSNEVTASEEATTSEEVTTSGDSDHRDMDPPADMHSVEEIFVTPPSLRLVMVGDVLLHTPVEKSALQENGSYHYDALFSQTAERIRSADIALVNQEVILGGEDLGVSGYPAFNAPFSVADALSDAGFDMICHATNHALDKGKKGLLACIDNWQTTHPEIAVLGIHDREETAENRVLLCQVSPADSAGNPEGENRAVRWGLADDSGITDTTETLTIAFLNYTYGTNGIALPDDMPYAVDLLDEEKVLADISLAEELADFTVVCPHWGTEYRLTPDAYQQRWSNLFLENGVDLVIGTHPHVIEPVEMLIDDSGHRMLVYYSLGNYVNWTSSEGDGIANRMVGGMADVTISLDDSGNAVIEDYGVDALVAHLTPGVNGVTTYFLSDYTEELAAKNAIIAQDPHFSLPYCIDLCDSVWGDLWQ